MEQVPIRREVESPRSPATLKAAEMSFRSSPAAGASESTLWSTPTTLAGFGKKILQFHPGYPRALGEVGVMFSGFNR